MAEYDTGNLSPTAWDRLRNASAGFQSPGTPSCSRSPLMPGTCWSSRKARGKNGMTTRDPQLCSLTEGGVGTPSPHHAALSRRTATRSHL